MNWDHGQNEQYTVYSINAVIRSIYLIVSQSIDHHWAERSVLPNDVGQPSMLFILCTLATVQCRRLGVTRQPEVLSYQN